MTLLPGYAGIIRQLCGNNFGSSVYSFVWVQYTDFVSYYKLLTDKHPSSSSPFFLFYLLSIYVRSAVVSKKIGPHAQKNILTYKLPPFYLLKVWIHFRY